MRHLKPALVYCLILVGCLICPQLSLAGTIDLGGGGSSGSGGVGDRAKTSATIDSLLACEDQTNNICRVESQWDFETVAASQTDQVMGTTGAAGDLLHAVHCVWTAAPAAVTSIKDGSGAAINIFEVKGAAGSQTVILDLVSADGGWKLTTSTNMTCIGIGRFS